MVVKDESIRSILTKHILREHNDYRRKFVQTALLNANLDTHYFIHAILDALASNKKFAFKESEKLISSHLLKEEKHRNKHDTYILVETLSKKLVDEYPNEYLEIFHRCFIEAANKNGQYTTRDLLSLDVGSYNYKLMTSYKSLLARTYYKGDKIKSMVTELITTNNECAICIAFEIMAINPSSYNEEILAILNIPAKMDYYLHGDIGYYFLALLSNWYAILDEQKRFIYKEIILNYKSPKDFLSDKHRYNKGALYPYLWYDKWKLISVTLPEVDDDTTLNRCRQELYRRYNNRSYKLEKPNHHVCMAEICGGILNEERFAKLSLDNWLNIFAIDDRWHYNRKPIDLRVNAAQFKECVSENPNKFLLFVCWAIL